MHLVKLEEASKRLDELVREVRAGGKVIISDGVEPVAELVAVNAGHATMAKRLGVLKGTPELPDSFFFGPLSSDEEDLWWSSGEP